jgi:hypothetical protein
VLGLLVVIWFGMTLYDRKTTNDWRKSTFANLAQQIVRNASPRASDPPLTTDEAKALAAVVNTPPRGTPGLTRTLLALGLLALIGVALVALVVGDGSKASDLLKTVVTALTGALATVLGFYFGAKTSSDATTTTVAHTTTPPSAKPASPTVPDGPTIISATKGTTPGSVEISFAAPANDGGAAIDSYTVTAYQGGTPVLYLTKPQTAALPITIFDLESKPYTFTAHASNRVGFSKESDMSDPITPD